MSDKNLTALKTLVISMGVVLIIGFIVVCAGMWMKMKGTTLASPKAVGSLPANCPGGSVDMKGRGQVIDTAIEGQTLRLAFTKEIGQIEIVHVDLCSGKELSALKVNTDVPPSMTAEVPFTPTLPVTPPQAEHTEPAVPAK